MADDVRKTVSTTSGGTLYLILIQVASRALTFIGNQFLLRFLSPQLLGIAVQLELFSVSVLYFSRESLRVALQRQPGPTTTEQAEDEKQIKSRKSLQSQTIVNLSYLAVALGSVLTASIGYLWFYQADAEVLQSPYFTTSLLLYGGATFVELLSEPSFVVIQQNLLYKSRAQAETWAAIIKCLAACSTAVLGQRLNWKPSVLPFAVGQCGYAAALLILYLASVSQSLKREGFSMMLKPVVTKKIPNRTGNAKAEEEEAYHLSYFSKPLLNLALTLYAQSIFKQLLTQGDAFILSFLTTLADQGAFALAANYGGLAARLVFQPIEESSRNAFGKLLGGETTSTASKLNTNDNKPHNEPNSNNIHSPTANGPSSSDAAKGPPSSPILSAKSHLLTTLHLYTLLSLFLVTYLPTLLPCLVRLLIGPAWFTASTSTLLSLYSYTLPLLAFNGILDAFSTSVATPAQLRAKTVAMGCVFAGYCVLAAGLLKGLGWGAEGLVVANGVAMGVRIFRGWGFMTRYFAERGVGVEMQGLRPSGGAVASCVLGKAVLSMYTAAAEPTFMGYKGPLAALVPVLGISGVGGLAILFFERHFLMHYLSAVLPERHAAKVRAWIK